MGRIHGVAPMRRHRARTLLVAFCVAGTSVLGACSDGSDAGEASFSDAGIADAERSDVAAQLRAAGVTTFASALDVVDIGQLVDASEFTLLAPSDVAFQSMDPDEMGDLLADPTSLLDVLRNHVLGEQLGSVDLSALSSVRTQTGNDLVVSTSGGVLTIGGATVSSVDHSVEGGIVHIVDQVLVP